jgi:hypothetical protein
LLVVFVMPTDSHAANRSSTPPLNGYERRYRSATGNIAQETSPRDR